MAVLKPRVAKQSWLALAALAALSWGCHSATDPDSACFVEPPSGQNQAALFTVLGSSTCGTGATSVSTIPTGSLAAVIKFRVRGARPNTLYYVQRAAEFPPTATSADGRCQRAEGGSPWTPADGFPDALWVPFPLPQTDQGPIKTLTTDAVGDGALDFEYRAPGIPGGARFDVSMRLVDANVGDSAGVTSELRSGCMTVLPQ